MSKSPFALIISGPTASGKSDLSLCMAKQIPSEIINADIGQFYVPFSIGTAKPDWKNSKVPHHLFDVINEPKSLTVAEYRKIVFEKVKEITQRGKLPIIVGGSLFYLKSLYYPPLGITKSEDKLLEESNLWKKLKEIDPERASKLHPNDIYRIKRALKIWEDTNIKPSLYEPKFDPGFNSLFIFINPPKETLQKRINDRTVAMIEREGWIDEVRSIMGTEWEPFLKIKRLIGYPEIIDWINAGEENTQLASLGEVIRKKTWQYARRQIIFWRSFEKQLEKSSKKSTYNCYTFSFRDPSEKTALVMVNKLREIS